MLVLTIKHGTSIMLDDGKDKIQVVGFGSNGSDMKIGIDAPRQYKVARVKTERRINGRNDKQLDIFEDK